MSTDASNVRFVRDHGGAGDGTTSASEFADAYEHYREPLFRYLRSQTGDDVIADDLTAQVFYRILATTSRYRGEGTYEAWLFQIARNVLSSWRVKSHREIPIEAIPDQSGIVESPASLTVVDEERELVRETIADLPDAQREVLRLRYWKNLTVDEIARVTRRSSGAVRQLLHRARQGLRRRLSTKDVTALLSATGASALAAYSLRRHRRRRR